MPRSPKKLTGWARAIRCVVARAKEYREAEQVYLARKDYAGALIARSNASECEELAQAFKDWKKEESSVS